MPPRPPVLPVIALLLAACIPAPSASPSASVLPSPSTAALRPVTLLLGFRPDVQFAPFYLAQQAGYYAEVGLDVTIEHSTDVLLLVADGRAEFGVADATDVMIARTSGVPVKYISTLYNHFPVALIGADGSVPSIPSELAGLRIGTPGRFGSSWHALLALLDADGMSVDDVTIREYPQFNQVEGLLNGDVDLITGFRNNEPLRLEAQGMSVELLTIDEIAPLPGPGIVAGDELLASDAALASAFADATLEAQQAIAANPQVGLDAAIAAVPAIGEDRATALAVLTATVELWGTAAGASIDQAVWTSGYEILLRLGFID
ncbi:MAG: ABC transporter substrate-binding protein, partial [Chloroflexota bacterium]|nr:ABC transporter substrate-binding protein [Chloroflexota bacterium]